MPQCSRHPPGRSQPKGTGSYLSTCIDCNHIYSYYIRSLSPHSISWHCQRALCMTVKGHLEAVLRNDDTAVSAAGPFEHDAAGRPLQVLVAITSYWHDHKWQAEHAITTAVSFEGGVIMRLCDVTPALYPSAAGPCQQRGPGTGRSMCLDCKYGTNIAWHLRWVPGAWSLGLTHGRQIPPGGRAESLLGEAARRHLSEITCADCGPTPTPYG